ncbi:MAG TPA: hypothetical protein VM694_04750 [Polyangium sp.]|nr:hypothetical protein [Polyangium sp.]
MSILKNFLSRLLRDEKLQRAFTQDPETTMKSAGLGDEDRARLRAPDRRQFMGQLTLGTAVFMTPPIGTWFAPILEITGPVQPDAAHPGAVLESFTVKGRYFSAGMKATLEGKERSVPVEVSRVEGAGLEESKLIGTLRLPNDLPPGAYTLRVTRSIDDQSATLPQGFRVQ